MPEPDSPGHGIHVATDVVWIEPGPEVPAIMDQGHGGVELADQLVGFAQVGRGLVGKVAFSMLLCPLRIPGLLMVLGWLLLDEICRYQTTFGHQPSNGYVDVRFDFGGGDREGGRSLTPISLFLIVL